MSSAWRFPMPEDTLDMVADIDKIIDRLEHEKLLEAGGPFRFTDLPTEIQNQIIDDLNFPDLCRFMATGRALRYLVSEKHVEAALGETARDTLRGCSWNRWVPSYGKPATEYMTRDWENISRRLPCFGCKRLCHEGLFVFSWLDIDENSSHPYQDHAISPHNRLKVRAELILQGVRPLPELGPNDLCHECILVRPEYLEREGHGKRWLCSGETDLLICIQCEKLKIYDRKSCKKDRPSIRQMATDLCHECWEVKHQTWIVAKAVLESRVTSLDEELRVLKPYFEWMEKIDSRHRSQSYLPRPFGEGRASSLPNQEPWRGEQDWGYVLNNFPDSWKKELSVDEYTGLPVPGLD